MSFTYQPGIPTGSVPLNQDYLNIQDNFKQLNVAYGVDHIPFSDTSGIPPGGLSGMHTIIHLQSKALPATLANVGQLFNSVVDDGLDTDTILFYLTGKGKILQLTSNLQPLRTANGYTFLPGGLIMQWMTINAPSSGTTYTFPITFPNSFLNLQLTAVVNDNSTIRVGAASIPTASGFTLESTNSAHFTNLFVSVIGF